MAVNEVVTFSLTNPLSLLISWSHGCSLNISKDTHQFRIHPCPFTFHFPFIEFFISRFSPLFRNVISSKLQITVGLWNIQQLTCFYELHLDHGTDGVIVITLWIWHELRLWSLEFESLRNSRYASYAEDLAWWLSSNAMVCIFNLCFSVNKLYQGQA